MPDTCSTSAQAAQVLLHGVQGLALRLDVKLCSRSPSHQPGLHAIEGANGANASEARTVSHSSTQYKSALSPKKAITIYKEPASLISHISVNQTHGYKPRAKREVNLTHLPRFLQRIEGTGDGERGHKALDPWVRTEGKEN